MKTRIMLINAPTIGNQFIGMNNYFPVGLLYLGTMAKIENCDIKLIDVNNYFYNNSQKFDESMLDNYIEGDLCSCVKDFKPDIIGIGCTFSGVFRGLKKIAARIKDLYPNTPIVIGGIHPTIFAREILIKYDFIDYVVLGEGEITFLELVKCITTNNRQVLDSIDGLAFRYNDEVKINQKTKFVSNLDSLPCIDYSILDIREYKMDTSKWYSPKGIKIGQPFNIITSRSCPQRCTFCSMWMVHGPKFRSRTSTNVLDEIEYLYNTYGVRYFEFMDDNMTFDKKRTLEICNGIMRRKLNIQFATPNGVAMNRLDKEIIDVMVSAGMIWISIAPESGSEFMRNKIIRKGLKNEKIYEVANACAKHKHLFIKGFFIIGMPQETHETLEETYKMIKELPFDKVSLFYATPYPGTELFDYCVKNNLIPYKAEHYMEVDDFQDSAGEPHFKPHALIKEDLIEFKKKVDDYFEKKRKLSNFPSNYPMRYCINESFINSL